MESLKGLHSFVRRVRRGVIIFQALGLASAAFTGFELLRPGCRSWAASSFLAALLFGLARNHIRGRYFSARKVSENPEIVYWGHATTRFEHFSSEEIKGCRILTLHLRDGTQLEIDLPPAEMCNFVAWLRIQNLSMRWGSYDESEGIAGSACVK